MQEGEAAFLDQRHGVGEHLFAFGRETGDQIGAEHDVGPEVARLAAEADRIVAQMPALHALQDHVVAGLQAEMQVRHQPRLLGDQALQVGIHLDLIRRWEGPDRLRAQTARGSSTEKVEPSPSRDSTQIRPFIRSTN